MSVYKEGYQAKNAIEAESISIFGDAADFGAPTTKGDGVWRAAKCLTEMYGIKETRNESRYSTGRSVSIEVVLMDEWAVSDERKTVKQATERYLLTFTSCNTGRCKGKDGFIDIQRIN